MFNKKLQDNIKISKRIMSLINSDTDQETIGLLICKDKNYLVVDYAIGGKDKLMAFAEYRLSEMSSEFTNCLPSKEEVESIVSLENK